MATTAKKTMVAATAQDIPEDVWVQHIYDYLDWGSLDSLGRTDVVELSAKSFRYLTSRRDWERFCANLCAPSATASQFALKFYKISEQGDREEIGEMKKLSSFSVFQKDGRPGDAHNPRPDAIGIRFLVQHEHDDDINSCIQLCFAEGGDTEQQAPRILWKNSGRIGIDVLHGGVCVAQFGTGGSAPLPTELDHSSLNFVSVPKPPCPFHQLTRPWHALESFYFDFWSKEAAVVEPQGRALSAVGSVKLRFVCTSKLNTNRSLAGDEITTRSCSCTRVCLFFKRSV